MEQKERPEYSNQYASKRHSAMMLPNERSYENLNVVDIQKVPPKMSGRQAINYIEHNSSRFRQNQTELKDQQHSRTSRRVNSIDPHPGTRNDISVSPQQLPLYSNRMLGTMKPTVFLSPTRYSGGAGAPSNVLQLVAKQNIFGN